MPQKYKRHQQPWKGEKIQITYRSNEDIKTLGIPRDWFPRDAQRFRVQKFKVQPPTEYQKKKGILVKRVIQCQYMRLDVNLVVVIQNLNIHMKKDLKNGLKQTKLDKRY